MKERFVLGVALALIALPAFGDAEPGEEQQKNPVTLKEVVVTGARTEQEVERVPAHVSVIDASDIRNSNAKNVVDLLRSQAGISVRDVLGNGKKAEIDLRGFGETGPYNTLVLVDGRRVNMIDLSGVDWMQIPLDQIERIEIVRGTGTVLYGDNAVGGVINIITKIPSDKLAVSAGAALGSYSRNKDRLSLSGGKDRVAASLYAGYDSTDGYRENNEMRAKDIGGKITYDATDFLSLNLSGSYHEDEYGLPGALSEAQVQIDRRAAKFPIDDAETKDEYLKLGLDLAVGDSGALVSDFSLQNRNNLQRFSTTWLSDTDTEIHGITPRYIWTTDLMERSNTLIAGVDLYRAEQETLSGPPSAATGLARVEKDSLGLYMNDEFSLMEDLVLSLGARRERVKYDLSQKSLPAGTVTLQDTVQEREYAYSAGLTFLYGDQSSLFARANRSVRFPLTDELVETDQTTFLTRINSDLKPQKGRHYDVGIKHHFSKSLSGTLTLFRAEIKNEIFYDPTPAPFFGTNVNHPETLHQGVEIGSKVRIHERLELLGNYTYAKATFERDPFEGKDIPAVPRHKVNLGLRVIDIMPGLIFAADYNYVGSSSLISDQANSLAKLDAYYTVDTKLSYTWNRVSAFVGVNNVTNQEYAQYGVAGGGGTTRNFYPAPERNWIGGLEIVF